MSRETELSRLAAARDWPAYHRALGGRVTKLTRADLVLPEPEVTATSSWPEDVTVPASVTGLQKLAKECGWESLVTYARGTRWGVGTKMVLVHSAAVRLSHLESGRGAVALWEAKLGVRLAWTVDSAYLWSRDGFPVEVGVTELKKIIKEEL